MIDKNKIRIVWFPNNNEIKRYLSKFNKPLNLKKEIQELILSHYNQTLGNLKPKKLDTKYPNCYSELKKQEFDNGYFRYVCPNFPSCNGYIMNQYDYNIAKNKGYKINKFSQCWMDNLIKDLKNRNYNISRNLVYRFLKEKGLNSPAKIERDLIRKYESREYNYGEGYSKARQLSQEQELEVKEKLIGRYGFENVKYQQFIFYNLKNDSKTYHKKPDFIVFREDDSIMIVEAKLDSCYINKEQEQDYRNLLEFMFPKKMVTFLYEIKEKFNLDSLTFKQRSDEKWF